MKAEELLDLLGDAEDGQILDARQHRKKNLPAWTRWTAAAACICLLLSGGVSMLFRAGGNTGSGGDGNLDYMYYPGPVLPLTVQGDAAGITAERTIHYDFSPYHTVTALHEENGQTFSSKKFLRESRVTDVYTLQNLSGEDQHITLLYPVTGTMRDWEYYPTITVNGEAVVSHMYPGPYTGGFASVWGSDDSEGGSVSGRELRSFEEYQRLFSHEDYQAAAFDEFPDLHIPVIVYRLSDFRYSTSETAESPTLCMRYDMDYEKTMVLSYGMNGCTYDREAGSGSRFKSGICYRPNLEAEFQHPEDGYVIVLGKDIKNYTVTGFRDGGCEPGEELDDLGCTVDRYETTLDEIVGSLLSTCLQKDNLLGKKGHQTENLPLDLYDHLTAELMSHNGLTGNAHTDQYNDGMLENVFSDVFHQGRILYWRFEVNIPAGECVRVEASMNKQAGRDYVGKKKSMDGYDLATQLGSNLTFTRLSASVSGTEEIEILDQNFGFDLTEGITQVLLDLQQPYYWMQIRKIPNPN